MLSELTTGGINFGYVSPIDMIFNKTEEIYTDMSKKHETYIMAELKQKIGIAVDKEELIKALQYDRNQYDKGYSDGRASMIEELEKIKADFEEIKGPRDNPYNNKTEYSVSMKELREVFDKHIAELKGE